MSTEHSAAGSTAFSPPDAQVSLYLAELALALATKTSTDFIRELLAQFGRYFEASEVFLCQFPTALHNPSCYSYWREGQFVEHKLSPVSPELLEQFDQQASCKIENLAQRYPEYLEVQPDLDAELSAFWAHSFALGDSGKRAYLAMSFKADEVPEANILFLLQPFIYRLSSELEQIELSQELSLSAVAFETNEGIIITNHQFQIMRVNAAFSRITGYQEQEVVGCDIQSVFGEPRPAFIAEEAGAVTRQGEALRHRRCGQAYTQLETITAVSDELQNLSHYVICIEDISERKRNEQTIENLAFFDELTGLPNRRKLREELVTCFEHAQQQEHIGALLFIDLDHFKNINDSLGHAAGDWVLQQVAKRLQGLIRQGDVLARLGGDEFVLMLSDLGQSPPHAEQQANLIGKRLIKEISAPYPLDGQSLHIGASVGITLFPGKGQQVEDLLKQADTAMYRAKSAGRRTVIFFEDGMQRDADRRLNMHNALRSALSKDELLLYFQPQHMVSTGELVGAEALVRWQPEGKSIISPTEFIPLAEESDLVIDIGMWVMEQSCKHMERWQKMGLILPELSVNVSAKQFHHPDFVDRVEELMWRYQIDTATFNLEITESVVLGHAEDTIRKMEQLKAIGLRFSIDDFGAGYSSLSYLKRLPVDELKIDRSFIRDIPKDNRDMAIVDAVLAMARHLGFTVTAEGVETRQQLDFLKQQGCTFYQGYLSSKAIPVEAMERYIQRFQRKFA